MSVVWMWSFRATLRPNRVCGKNLYISSWSKSPNKHYLTHLTSKIVRYKKVFCAQYSVLSMLTSLSSYISICQLITKLRPGKAISGSIAKPTDKHRTKKWGLCRVRLRCYFYKRHFHVQKDVAFSNQYEYFLVAYE